MAAQLSVAQSEDTPASFHTVELFCMNVMPPAWLENVIPFVVKVLEYRKYRRWTLSVVFCDDTYIQNLNMRYRHQNYPTDVLSFSQISTPAELPADHFDAGDLIISLEMLSENARYFHVDEEEELKRLLIHGILHLGGWDHADNNPEQIMLKMQEEILRTLLEEKIY
ncbi:MAG: rRNA maturation RNase YbeY [Salinispira sp.]